MADNWNMPTFGNNGLSNAYGSNTDYGQSFNYGASAASQYPELYQAPSTSPNPQQSSQGIFGRIYGGVKDAFTSGGTDAKGYQTANAVSGGISAIASLTSAYMGMKQYGLAKNQFDFQKQAYDENRLAQATNYNTEIKDRQRARVASNPGAYEPVGSYMDKNRIG